MHTRVRAHALEHPREQGVGGTVVERDVGRGPEDDDHAVPVHSEPVQHARVGLEVGEVVLLLEARVLDELLRPDAVAS